MGSRGRISKLTPAVSTAITQAVALGVPLSAAAAYAGIDKRTALEWIARGEERHQRASRDIYAEFAHSLMRAGSADQMRRVARIELAAKGGAVVSRKTTTYPDGRVVVTEEYSAPDWRADAFHLERLYSESWGKKQAIDLHLSIQRAAEKVAADMNMTPEEVLREAQHLLQEMDNDAA
jgi:hypothetical protein